MSVDDGRNVKAGRTGPLGLVRRFIEIWALLGGLLLVVIVLVTAASAAGNLAFAQPIAGDFEIVQIGVAVAVFAFLPYCQLTGANVSADIFTSWASVRTQAVFGVIASLVAVAFTAILLWRMYAGLLDYHEYAEYSPIIGFPIWMAFVPILMSLALLLVAALITTFEALLDARRHA